MSQSTPTLTVTVKLPHSISSDGIAMLAIQGAKDGKPAEIKISPCLLSSIDNQFTIEKGFSGRIYFFMPRKGEGAEGLVKKVPTNPSEINTKLDTLRYDMVEITYDGSFTACANLSSVDQLGFALGLKAISKGGATLQSVGYKSSFLDIYNKIENETVESIPQSFSRLVSPLHIDKADQPNLDAYLKSLDGQIINLEGNYDGSKDAGGKTHAAAHFSYTCNFKHDDVVLKANPGSGIQHDISIPNFADMIFPCEGAFNVEGSDAGANRNGKGDKVGFNDPWSTVVRNFLVGFNVGFFGFKEKRGEYVYDCNNSWDWEDDFAFKNTFKGGPCWNEYARIISENSNSYGFPFSDVLGRPLVNLSEASKLQIRVFDDEEVDTESYYTAPPQTPTPENQGATESLCNGNYRMSVILDGNSIIAPIYTGEVNFAGRTFQFGQDAQWDPNDPYKPHDVGKGICIIYSIPTSNASNVYYNFSLRGKPFNLFVKTSEDGKISSAAVDGGLSVRISDDKLNLTIINILDHVSPKA